MSNDVQHLAGQNRYLFSTDGTQVGLTDYQVKDNTIFLTHTEIDPRLRGAGLGGQMVQAVLDKIRVETNYRVVAACPFVRFWLDEHPDYLELELRGGVTSTVN